MNAFDRDPGEQEYLHHLNRAHIAAQDALDALHDEDGPKRNIFTRMRIGRAQSALISTYVRELARQEKEPRGK